MALARRIQPVLAALPDAVSVEWGMAWLEFGEGVAGQHVRPPASGVGLVPEQEWENPDLPASPYGTDPTVASIGFADGHPAGLLTAAPNGAFVITSRRTTG